jgi:hypothetical protein
MWGCRWTYDTEHAGEEEGAAIPHLAFHPDASTHHLYQTRTDGETETGTAMFARGGSVGLAESFENETLLVGGNADAGILHREQQRDFRFLRLIHACFNKDAAVVGEFDRIPD